MTDQVQQLEMKAEAKGRALSNSPVGKIIVVDDELELRNILVEALSARGFEVTGCSSGQQALAELRQKEFDLLLTDLMMPEMDGIALMEAALKVDPHLVGIMMTGQGTIQTAVDAMKVGAFDYVLKPFRLQTVMPVLTRAITTRRLHMENLQLRETVAIYSLCQTIAFTLDAQTVLSRLADAALQQSDADEVSILLPTSDGKELYVAAVRGEKRERLLGERIPLQESISSWVARERMPLILNGEVRDERFVALWPRPEIRSAVSVPMQVANKLVGIINLNVTNRLRPFTLGQMKALTILSSTAAAALESASLYTQVRTTEEKYRSIFENATEGLFQSTSDGRLLTANPALARILGYDSPDEMIATITDIAHQLYINPEDRAEAARLQEEAGGLVGFEMEAYPKDGEKIWLSLNRRSVRNQNGEVLYFEGSVEDITERKRAEEERAQLTAEIENQRQRLNNIVASVPGVVWEAWGQPDTEAQRMNFVSDYVETMLGYTVDEWLSTPNFWLTIVHPDDKGDAGRVASEAFASGKGSPQEFRWMTKDGRAIWVESNYAVIKDERGRAVGLRGVTTDISERKRAEEALRESVRSKAESLALLDTILSTAPIGFAFHDRDLVYQRINESLAAINGLSVEQHLGKTLRQVLPEMSEILETLLQRVIATGEPIIDLEISGETPADLSHPHHWLVSFYPVRMQEGELLGVGVLVSEITERKRAEEALRQSESQLAEAQRLAHIGSWNWDLQKNVLTWSDEHFRIFGVQPGNIDVNYDEVVFDFIHPEDRELVRGVVAKSIETQESFNFYYRIVRRDGEERIIHSTGSIETDERGQPIRMFGTAQDVTEHRRIEQELRQSEERYRDLVENAHDLIYEHDLEGNYTSTNKAAEMITGYTLEESLKLNLAQAVAPEYQEKAREMLRRKLAGETVTAYELEIIAKDGRRVPVEVNTRLVLHDGVPVGVQGIARDITERKRVEEIQARRAAHALFRADVSAALATSRAPLRATLGSCVTAMVQHLGAAFARIWTLNREEEMLELQASAGMYTHIDGPHSRVPVGSFKIGKIAQERAPHITNEVHTDPRVSDKEWARREGMVAFAGYPLLLENRLLGVMAMFSREELAEDTLDALASVGDLISQGIERKRAEEELRESEERYRLLFESSPQPMWVYDLETLAFLAVNESAVRHYGYSREDFLAMTIKDIRPAEDISALYDSFARSSEGVDAASIWRHLKKDGTIIEVEITSHLLVFDDRRAELILVHDITERNRLEAALLASQDQLRQSQKLEAIGQLAGGVAHDFNNLLTVIGGYSSILLVKLPQDSPHRSSIEEIKKASDRASRLTRQLLAFSRKQILQPKVLDLNTVVADLEKMVRRLIGEDIDLLTITSPVLGKVKADPGQIEQVLLNLIVNARDAMTKGGKLTIETRNVVHSEEYAQRHAALPGPYVMLAVSDTGCGMDAAIQPHVFEPFFTTKGPGKGTGLGLATVYGIVKQSGGNIWVYSEVERGSTFKVYLPRVDETGEEEAAVASSAVPLGTELILLVEDEDQVRAILKQILEGQGYRVLAASNGEEALSISQDLKRDIKLMITDVVMPQMSGRELVERVLTLRPSLPVLFMSGYTDDAIVRHGLLDEKLNFIQKPFDSATVARKVREVLDSRPDGRHN